MKKKAKPRSTVLYFSFSSKFVIKIMIIICIGHVVPERRLSIAGKTFEQQVSSAIHDVFEPFGFNVLCWTRLPYLCEGDLVQDYYWLDDAVFILSIRNPSGWTHRRYTTYRIQYITTIFIFKIVCCMYNRHHHKTPNVHS